MYVPPIIFQDSTSADCLEKLVNTETDEVLDQKAYLSHTSTTKIYLKDAWKVQREDHHQRGTSTGRLVADEGKMEPKMDTSIQGILHAEVEQYEDDRIRLIRRLVHQVKTHPNKDALIADLQSNHPYSPFSEEAKQMIRNLGIVECFVLCEISPRDHLLYLWVHA